MTLSNFKERKMNWRTFTENTVSSCGEKQNKTVLVSLSKSTPLPKNRDQLGWVVQSRVKGNPPDSAKFVTIVKRKIQKHVYHKNTTMNNISWKDVIIILETEDNLYFGRMINALLIKFICSRWLAIVLILLPQSVSVHPSQTYKNPQRGKIIHGMHPDLGCKEWLINLKIFW